MKACCAMLFLGLSALAGCGTSEKEKEPVVTVQTQPAERQSISQFVSAEAVVFPLRQATVSPKITSTIADFKVQRGARVKRPIARDPGKQRPRRTGRSKQRRFRSSRRNLRHHGERWGSSANSKGGA